MRSVENRMVLPEEMKVKANVRQSLMHSDSPHIAEKGKLVLGTPPFSPKVGSSVATLPRTIASLSNPGRNQRNITHTLSFFQMSSK